MGTLKRRIVPTNMVHTLQRGDKTVSYGIGKGTNVYYAFPPWLPLIGVIIRVLPVSNFDIQLKGYSAFDKDRVPFVVDIVAFFHIADTNKAAEKVESFEELKGQLTSIVQGTVRSILAKSKLEQIMEERSTFGAQFTENVIEDLKSWGVEAIKNIELMDVRDSDNSQVIHQIMAKRMSAIDMESRTEVAANRKKSQQAELTAQQEIDVTKAETEQVAGEAAAKSQQAIKIAQAQSAKESGIAEQVALSEIAVAQQETAKKNMEVVRVNQIQQAEINKDAAIVKAEEEKKTIEITAEANKFKITTTADADKEAKLLLAQGTQAMGTAEAAVILAKGTSEAESKKLMELAGVTAQTTLAADIGENKSYQDYMVRIREVEANQVIGVSQAENMGTALAQAELKLLINSGDVNSGIGKLSDVFTSKGGSQINGLLEALKQTEEGRGILSLIEKFKGKE